MVLHALGHNNQIASGSLARRCENDSLMSFCTRRFNWMEFCLTFLTRSGHLFLPRACEAATTLQTSEGSDAVNGAVRLEVYAQWMAGYSGRPVNLSTQRQRTVGPLKLLFWWRLSDELMNVVQVLEAFFDFQDVK